MACSRLLLVDGVSFLDLIDGSELELVDSTGGCSGAVVEGGGGTGSAGSQATSVGARSLADQQIRRLKTRRVMKSEGSIQGSLVIPVAPVSIRYRVLQYVTKRLTLRVQSNVEAKQSCNVELTSEARIQLGHRIQVEGKLQKQTDTQVVKITGESTGYEKILTIEKLKKEAMKKFYDY